MAGGSCPEENVSEKQDDSVHIMDGISLKQDCKSHYTEAKGTNKSCENLLTKEIKFLKPHMTGSELNLDRMKTCKRLVEKAIKLKKIFTIYGPYPLIRQSLRNRGWLEKKMPKPLKSPQKKDKIINGENDVDDGIGDSDGCDFDDKQGDDKDNSDDPDNIYNITSRLLKNETAIFLWTNGTEAQNLQKDQIFNHYVGAGSFTTKAGLCVNLRNFQWFNGVNPDTFFPRCYRIAVAEEKQSFIEDFRMTAARSILKWVVELKKKSDVPHKGPDWKDRTPRSSVMEAFHRQTRKKGGVVPVQLVETALRACEEYLNTMDHKDIDVSLDTPPAVTERCWEETIQQYYEVIHEGATIQNWKVYAAVCENMLKQLQEANTQLKMEGMRNIWIVKPGAQSRGRGITCMNRLEQIMKLVYGQTTFITDGKWVVQKYIEHPLLIYGTKFDMRQWFLVTDWNPVTIWYYKDCYLRFSSQAFSLDNLDTAIHLCNNSIQKHFVASSNRHPFVPRDNMWSSNQFKEYLNKNGFGNIWEDIISPGMKKAIVNTIQVMQDIVKPRKNSFELYGADFLLGEDFKPWLIEINCSPTMSPSTPVTATLCSNVQEDTIKVVIDRRYEKTSDTGGFELLYKQCTMAIPLYLGINLLVEGSSIKKPPALIPKSQSNGLRNISQISETVQKICGLTSQHRQVALNDDVNKPANAESAKNRDYPKLCSNLSKSKLSAIDTHPEFAKRSLNLPATKSYNTSNIKNLIYFGNERNPLLPIQGKVSPNLNNSGLAKSVLNFHNLSMVKNSLIPNHFSITKNVLYSMNSSATKNLLNPSNSSITRSQSNSTNSSMAKDLSDSSNSSTPNDSLNPNDSSVTKNPLSSTVSNIAKDLSNPSTSSTTDSSLNPNKSSHTKDSLIPNHSNDLNNSTVPNPNIAKNHNIPQDSNHIQDHGSSNTCGKEKTVDNTNNCSKIKTSSISKHYHKSRNYTSYNRKKAKKLSSPKILGTSIVKAWDEMQKMKNNIAETTPATETENNCKRDPGDKVEQDYEVPKFNRTEGIRKVSKQRLQPKSKITQMSMSVKHLILPNRQMLRDPLHVNLKCLSLDLLNFKDMQHSRSSVATDANRVRTVHEKSTPLRYSYNSPRLQLKDPNIPQLHITGLQPQFKASSDISNKYIETHKNATSNLFNIKKHLLTSSFPLFQ
ncbi:tubulin tyrosine ligase 3-like [Rhincodon typus]|uniref:tubulin tyrosine ligase 3-like n=1 Tax=Rhincodon typus TaxID=259920 RepID=UPI00202E49F9|nr:tubulin tyrosine ligase 3-like [Rhincodon typus]